MALLKLNKFVLFLVLTLLLALATSAANTPSLRGAAAVVEVRLPVIASLGLGLCCPIKRPVSAEKIDVVPLLLPLRGSIWWPPPYRSSSPPRWQRRRPWPSSLRARRRYVIADLAVPEHCSVQRKCRLQ
jgi:hypothetical protein